MEQWPLVQNNSNPDLTYVYLTWPLMQVDVSILTVFVSFVIFLLTYCVFIHYCVWVYTFFPLFYILFFYRYRLCFVSCSALCGTLSYSKRSKFDLVFTVQTSSVTVKCFSFESVQTKQLLRIIRNACAAVVFINPQYFWLSTERQIYGLKQFAVDMLV